MPLEHELKIHPEHYARVANGSKTFEVRVNDRDYQQGDSVVLCEWDPSPVSATGHAKGFTDSPQLKFKVGHVHQLDKNLVVFSLLPMPANKKGKLIPIK